MRIRLLPRLLERLVRNKMLRVRTPHRSPHPKAISTLLLSGDLITQVDGEFWRTATAAEREALIADHNAALSAMVARFGRELTNLRRRSQWLAGSLISVYVAVLYLRFESAAPGEGAIRLLRELLETLWIPALLGLLPLLFHRIAQWRVRALFDEHA